MEALHKKADQSLISVEESSFGATHRFRRDGDRRRALMANAKTTWGYGLWLQVLNVACGVTVYPVGKHDAPNRCPVS